MNDAKSHSESENVTGLTGLRNEMKVDDVVAQDFLLTADQRWAEFVKLLLPFTEHVSKILVEESIESELIDLYCAKQGCAKDDSEIHAAQLLLAFGAELEIPNEDVKIPLHLALKFKKFYFVDFLNYVTGNGVGTTEINIFVRIQCKMKGFLKIDDDDSLYYIVSYLLDAGVDPNTVNARRLTALHVAVKLNKAALVQLLLKRGCSPNVKDSCDMSPLTLAVRKAKKSEKIVQLLIESGAYVDDFCRDVSLLKFAVRVGNDKVVQLLLENGAAEKGSYSLEDDELLLSALGHTHRRDDRLCIVTLLLDAGIHEPASTALHVAVADNDADLVRLLLERACPPGDPNQFDIPSQSVVFQLPKFFCEMCKLIDRGVPLNKYFKCKNMLDYAILTYDKALVEVLLELGYPPGTQNSLNVKPLLCSAIQQFSTDTEVVRLLLEYEVDDKFCLELIKLAIDCSKGAEVKLLLKKIIAIPRAILDYAMLVSSERGNLHIVKMVVTEGADINCKSSNNQTCLMLAAQNARFNVLTYLINHGAKLNEQDNEGNTALHCLLRMKEAGTTWFEIKKSIEDFLEAGADLNIENKQGHTSFRYVLSNSFTTGERNAFFKHIALLLALNKYVNPINLSYIEENNSWSEQFQVYQQELARMKELKVIGEFSYFQFISEVSYSKLIPLLQKDDILCLVVSKSELKNFKNYKQLLFQHFLKKYNNYKRFLLVKKATCFLSQIFQSKLPPEVAQKIAEYLPDQFIDTMIGDLKFSEDINTQMI